MESPWVNIVILTLLAGVMCGQLMMASQRFVGWFWKEPSGKPASAPPPGMPRIMGGGAIAMLMMALHPAFKLAGWEPPMVIYIPTHIVGLAAAGVLVVQGRRQSIRAMRARHQAELRALDNL
jgi:hypothetical protein